MMEWVPSVDGTFWMLKRDGQTIAIVDTETVRHLPPGPPYPRLVAQ